MVNLFTLITCLTLLPLFTELSSHSQTNQQSRHLATETDDTDRPHSMRECESGSEVCATWTFLNAQGNGQWPSGEVGNLFFHKVKVNDDSSIDITIDRADSTGSSSGLTATYKGTWRDGRVGGEYTSSWPGHWRNRTGNWYAVPQEPIRLPSVMHYCDAICFTLELRDGRYFSANADNLPSRNWIDMWTVESFSRESVVLHRTVTGGLHADLYYRGQMSSDGNSVTNGINPEAEKPGEPPQFRLVWGTALNTIPGNNIGRPSSGGSQQNANLSFTLDDARNLVDWLTFLKSLSDLLGN